MIGALGAVTCVATVAVLLADFDALFAKLAWTVFVVIAVAWHTLPWVLGVAA